MTFLKTNWIAVVAVVIALFALFHFSSPVKLGAVDTTCQGFTTCLSDLYLTTTGGGTGSFQAAGTALISGEATVLGTFFQGGSTATTAVEQKVSAGSCNTATSTIFGIVNPFTATSTATVRIYGLSQATTTALIVSTTTQATGLTSALIGAGSLVVSASIASTSQFYIQSGQSTLLGTGQVSAGTSVYQTVVGPSEYVGAYATSSIAAQGSSRAADMGFTSCTYKILWTL